jgi:hypothetical protein
VVGQFGRCATSPDGITWTEQTNLGTVTGNLTFLYSVAWTGSRFVAVGYQTTASPNISRCATSPDGVTWTIQPNFNTAFGDGYIPYAIVYSISKLVAVGIIEVGAASRCATSP